jgi:signal transduction histidine kinase
VRGFVDEVLFGGRPDPVRTLSRLGGQLSAGSTPHDWLETLRVALGAPAVLLRQDGVPLAATGELADAAPTVVTPLRVGAEVVGELVVGLAPQQLRPPPTTRAVLELVAGPLAQALRAARLSEQLQASRGRVVAALEEERRRMRRDLHDGLGPALASMTLQAEAARELLDREPDQAGRLLADLTAQLQASTADIRRLVYDLRPPALDDLGLVGALRTHLARVESATLRTVLEAPGELPALPAAVEVAAYRIAQEAVANMVHHAQARCCTVRLALDEEAALVVEVTDDGVGIAAAPPAGVGLRSMRERAAELGGACVVSARPEGGTRVRASLPTQLGASGASG